MAIGIENLSGIETGAFLFCYTCSNRASANINDYFMMTKDDVFMCCNEPMVLAKEEKKIITLAD